MIKCCSLICQKLHLLLYTIVPACPCSLLLIYTDGWEKLYSIYEDSGSVHVRLNMSTVKNSSLRLSPRIEKNTSMINIVLLVFPLRYIARKTLQQGHFYYVIDTLHFTMTKVGFFNWFIRFNLHT